MRTTIFTAMLMLATPIVLISQTPVSGYTVVETSVGQQGQATANVKLNLPKGGFVEPDLSIIYNSHSQNGLLGNCFSLEGTPFQSITRASATIEEDGFNSGAVYDRYKGRYVLNGARLKATFNYTTNGNGSVGFDQYLYNFAPGAGMRTEQETFNKVEPMGMTITSDGNRPTYDKYISSFQVTTKEGLFLQFGNTADSRIEAPGSSEIASWLLNKVTDKKGNFMTIKYTENNLNGESRPLEILYTGNTNLGINPYNRIVFNYENRPDSGVKYTQGFAFKTTKRLVEILAYDHENLYRKYVLSYAPGNSVSKLIKITEYGFDGISYLKPVIFNWKQQPAVYGFNKAGTGFWYGHLGGPGNNILGDFNGDGKIDIAGHGGYATWHVSLSTNSGFESTFWQAPANTAVNNLVGDFNGDGKTDISGYNAGKWQIGISTGSSFINSDWSNGFTGENYSNRYVGDFNGDGKADIGCYISNGNWHIYISNGNSFSVQTWNSGGATYGSGHVLLGDFNADGMTDIASSIPSSIGLWNISYSTGSSFLMTVCNINSAGVANSMVGDWNGDGIADIAGFIGNSNWIVSISKGSNGNFTSNTWTAHNNGISNNAVGDFNKDGITDIATYTSWLTWNVFLGNGNGFVNAGLWPGHAGGVGNNSTADFDGDGASDLIGYDSKGVWHVTLANPEKEFVTEIKNGNDVSYLFTYSPLTNSNIYKKDVSGIYPNIDFTGPFYVVSSLKMDDGVGGYRTINYKYANAKFNQKGRGFLGFEITIVIDSLSNTILTNWFSTDYRHISARLLKTELRTLDNKLLSKSEKTIAIKTFKFEKDSVYFSFFSKTIDSNFESNGNLIISKTTDYTCDDYGNTIRKVETYNNGYSVTTANTYSNNVFLWILEQLTESLVTKSMPGKPAISISSAFFYDYHGHLIKEVMLPGDPVLELTKKYTLDGFGNCTKNNVSGPGIITRSEDYKFDNNGRLLVESINAIGHISKITYKRGLPDSLINPNNQVTKIGRDVFGREISIHMPNGTNKTISYNTCSGVAPPGPSVPGVPPALPGCPLNGVHFTQEKVSGSVNKFTFYNKYDKVIRNESESFGSLNIVTDIIYNPDGTIKKESNPYFKNATTILWKEYSYDPIKRLIKSVEPGNRITQFQYNGLTRTITNPLNQVNTLVETPQGKLLKSIDNKKSELIFDYDSDLNPLSCTDPNGNKIIYRYNVKGNKIYMKDPDMGEYYYDYNALGLLTKVTNPKGEITSYQYDLINRRTQRVEPEETTTWTYDPPNAKGEQYQVLTNNNVVQEFKFNNFQQISSKEYTRDNKKYLYTYSYNAANGLISSITYPNNVKIQNEYTSKGYLNKVTGVNIKATLQTLWTANSYNEYNEITSYKLGNNLVTIKTFDAATSFLTEIKTGTSSVPNLIQSLTYSYSLIGNVTSRKDLIAGLAESISYTDLNQIEQSSISGGGLPGFIVTSMQYDKLGNIIYKSDVGTYKYGENGKGPHILTSINHSTATVNCTYNFDQAIFYNSNNFTSRMVKNDGSKEIIFSYGPDQEREKMLIKKGGLVVQTKRYYGALYEETINGNTDSSATYYVKAGSDIIAVGSGLIRRTGSGNDAISYLLKDNLGSVYAYTNETGNVKEIVSFDVWGRSRDPKTWQPYTTTKTLPSFQRGFTYHEMMDMDFLVCMNARIYNPVLGKFLSPDPLISEPDNLQALNRYSYVFNNPMSLTDPSGYFSFKKFIKQVAPIIVGVAIGYFTGGLGVATLGNWGSAVLTGASAGFGSGFTRGIVNGQGLNNSFKIGLQNSWQSAISGGITYGVDRSFPSLLSSKAEFPLMNAGKLLTNSSVVTNQLLNSTIKSTISGVFASYNGGSIKKSFFNSMFWESVSVINNSILIGYTRYDDANDYTNAVSWGPGKGYDKQRFLNGTWYGTSSVTNNILMDNLKGKDLTFWNGFYLNGGWLSRTLNFVPGMNSHANFHDAFSTMIGVNFGNNIMKILNVPTQIMAYSNYAVLINHTGMLHSFQQTKK
jgi:RHS repeat-associated protein